MNKNRLVELLKTSDVSDLANIFDEIFSNYDWLMQYLPETISIEEIEQAEKFGVKPVTLGNRILRCETASGFALACASFAFEL